MSNESLERTNQGGVLLGSNVAIKFKHDDAWYLGVVVKYRNSVVVKIEPDPLSLLISRVEPRKELYNFPSGEHLVIYDDGDTESVNPKVAKEGVTTLKIWRASRVHSVCVN